MEVIEKKTSSSENMVDIINSINSTNDSNNDLFIESIQAAIITETWVDLGFNSFEEWVTSPKNNEGLGFTKKEFLDKIVKKTKKEIINMDYHLEIQELRKLVGKLLNITNIRNIISKEKKVRECDSELYLKYLKGETKNIQNLYKDVLEKQKSVNKPETSENKMHSPTPSTDAADDTDIAKLFYYAEKLKHMFNIKIVYKNKKNF